jgi:multisubunit Na+/H+ antiporter MnhC subunit
MLLTALLITVAMLAALGVALYLAYRETEADFPLKHKPHRG